MSYTATKCLGSQKIAIRFQMRAKLPSLLVFFAVLILGTSQLKKFKLKISVDITY